MNKHVFGRKLSRSRPAREALFSSLIRSLIINGKIETTKAKAKAVSSQVEKFVTLAKKGELSGKRSILANLDNARDAFDALYQRVVPAFATKSSGFIRLIAIPNRRGDNAQMVRVEWTEKLLEKVEPKKEKAKKVVKKVEKEAKKQVSKKDKK